jgi:2-amino-4,5-dihydroxy-6-oxo-7-(phosphonooxy)heptanoate synthase
MTGAGKSLRMRRLSGPGDGKYLFVPLDHSVSDGPVVPQARWNGLVRALVDGGADAIIVHKGRARTISPEILRQCALVVHLSAGTPYAADVDAKVLVGGVEEAVRYGADAVSVHVNLGSDTERQQLVDLGTVAAACDTWSMPLFVMIYARGPRIADPHDPVLLAHAVNIAADLGADLVKTAIALPLDRMAEVVASCPVPVLAAGGAPDGTDLIGYGAAVMRTGCRGLAVGRRVFSAPSPRTLISQLTAVVHADRTAAGAGTAIRQPIIEAGVA